MVWKVSSCVSNEHWQLYRKSVATNELVMERSDLSLSQAQWHCYWSTVMTATTATVEDQSNAERRKATQIGAKRRGCWGVRAAQQTRDVEEQNNATNKGCYGVRNKATKKKARCEKYFSGPCTFCPHLIGQTTLQSTVMGVSFWYLSSKSLYNLSILRWRRSNTVHNALVLLILARSSGICCGNIAPINSSHWDLSFGTLNVFEQHFFWKILSVETHITTSLCLAIMFNTTVIVYIHN